MYEKLALYHLFSRYYYLMTPWDLSPPTPWPRAPRPPTSVCLLCDPNPYCCYSA